MKKSTSATTIILYILSVVLFVLGSAQLLQSMNYIVTSLNQGTVSLSADFVTIVSYISQACVTTYSFAVIFYVMGRAYNKTFPTQDMSIEKTKIEDAK